MVVDAAGVGVFSVDAPTGEVDIPWVGAVEAEAEVKKWGFQGKGRVVSKIDYWR